MATSITNNTSSVFSFEGIPPLEPGDRLTRAEFERRWEAMPNLKRAELIEGVVHMAAAVRHRQHGQPNRWISGLLGKYEAGTAGVSGSDNASVRLDLNNMPQQHDKDHHHRRLCRSGKRGGQQSQQTQGNQRGYQAVGKVQIKVVLKKVE